MPRIVLPLVAVVLAGAPALAGVLTVDDSGGADYTDLPAAVAAAAPGDVLWVHAGQYSAFTVDSKPLTVLGLAAGQVVVDGTSRVTGVVAPFKAVLCRLDFERLALSDNSGAVILDEVRVFGSGSGFFSVGACADVRAVASIVQSTACATWDPSGLYCALLVDGASRVEGTESLIAGLVGCLDQQQEGWIGALVRGGSRLHLAASTAKGGKGSDSTQCGPWICACFGATGRTAVLLQQGSRLRAAGAATDLIQGGKTGKVACYFYLQACPMELEGVGALAVYSGVTIDPPWAQVAGQDCVTGGAQLLELVPREPWLERDHTPLAGGQARFYVHGEPGDLVTLFVGRHAVVVPLPGVEVEQLTSQERSFELGAIGPTGVVSFAMTVPPFLTPGFAFFGQARILRNGVELRTNSVPIVLR